MTKGVVKRGAPRDKLASFDALWTSPSVAHLSPVFGSDPQRCLGASGPPEPTPPRHAIEMALLSTESVPRMAFS